jgi:hypothetical protein
MAQYAAPYIKTPLFLLNSALDSCQVRSHCTASCSSHFCNILSKANGCELGIDVSKVPLPFPRLLVWFEVLRNALHLPSPSGLGWFVVCRQRHPRQLRLHVHARAAGGDGTRRIETDNP